MSYKLEIFSDSNYLKVLLKGVFPRIDSEVIIKSIRESLEKHEKSRLLIDLRQMTTSISVLADYQAAEYFYQEKFTQIEKIAVIDREEYRLSNDFFETTAFNRGLKFKFFYEDESDAIAWLNEENDIE